MSRARRVSQVGLDQLGQAGDLGAQAHYADPAYYNKAYASRREDAQYYLELATRSRGPVLEYGVGTGRLALPMARAGVEVFGVDLSRAMLAELRARLKQEPPKVRARLRVARADMRRWRTERRFPLIIAGFNTVLHLYTRQDVEAFFARVQQHLTPRGRFVFDFGLTRPEDLALTPGRDYSGMRLRDPASGKLVKYSERFEYDPVRQVQLCWLQFAPVDGSPGWSVPLTHRHFFPQEMAALLHYAGFRDVHMTADFQDRPLTRTADWVVVSCRGPKRG